MEGLSDFLSFAHVVFQTRSSVDKLLEQLAQKTQKWVQDPADFECLGCLNVDKEEPAPRSFFRPYSSPETSFPSAYGEVWLKTYMVCPCSVNIPTFRRPKAKVG